MDGEIEAKVKENETLGTQIHRRVMPTQIKVSVCIVVNLVKIEKNVKKGTLISHQRRKGI